MSRCNCRDRACSCVIVGGSGVTVTGTGNPRTPYTIEADAGSSGGFQPGDLKASARTTAPPGWLACDGTEVDRDTYAALFDAIGTEYGPGDNGTTFNLPDFRGRFVMGADGTHPRGAVGGDTGVVLTVANLPAHQHSMNHDHPSVSTSSSGHHDHPLARSNASGSNTGNIPEGTGSTAETSRGAIGGDGDHTHTVDVPNFTGSTGSKGAGTPVDFLPPYGTALWFIKT